MWSRYTETSEMIIGARCWFVVYVKILVLKWHPGVFLQKPACISKAVASCDSHHRAMGNEATNNRVLVCSGSANTKVGQNTLGERPIVKCLFARGKWDIWQSHLVLGIHHNSTPPITVFNWTTIASTIITRAQEFPLISKPLWPQARLVVCPPGRRHRRLWLQPSTAGVCQVTTAILML